MTLLVDKISSFEAYIYLLQKYKINLISHEERVYSSNNRNNAEKPEINKMR